MTTTFITGADEGIGYETARQLIALGHRALLDPRDITRGEVGGQNLGEQFIRQGAQTLTLGVDALVELATMTPHGPTGTFRSRAGVVPW